MFKLAGMGNRFKLLTPSIILVLFLATGLSILSAQRVSAQACSTGADCTGGSCGCDYFEYSCDSGNAHWQYSECTCDSNGNCGYSWTWDCQSSCVAIGNTQYSACLGGACQCTNASPSSYCQETQSSCSGSGYTQVTSCGSDNGGSGGGGGGGGSSPDYSITFGPLSGWNQVIAQGSYTYYQITVNPANGYNSDITLTVNNCPPNATCTIQNPTVNPANGYTTTMQLTASYATPVNTYNNISIHGVGADAGKTTHDSNTSWVQVTSNPNPVDSSQCLGMTGVPARISAGSSFTPTVSMLNNGNTTWTSDSVNPTNPYRLGSQYPQDNTYWTVGRELLPGNTIVPGATAAFTFTATAPSNPGSVSACSSAGGGNYSCTFGWRMVREGVHWFGDYCSQNITITPAPVCPAGTVSLGSSSINAGNNTSASAPAGFTGGSFSSSNTSVATVSGSTINGVSAGTSNISGSGWHYSNGANNCSLTAAALTVNAVPAPTIQLNPTSFTFNGVSGGATPAGQTLTIKNIGNATLNWTASGVPGKAAVWCHISVPSGSLASGVSQNVTVSVDPPSNIGSFSDCGIRISDPNATNNPQDVSVTYTVTPGTVDSGSQPNTFSANPATCPALGVYLSWSAGTGANSYNIYRATSNNTSKATLVKITSALNWIDSTTTGGPYYYWVESVDTNSGLKSPWVPADTNATGPGVMPNKNCPPNPVPSLTGNNSVCQQITLSWTAPSVDANHPAPTSYWIYRNTTGTVPDPVNAPATDRVAAPAYPATNYTDSGLTPNTYYYWIVAVNGTAPASPTALTPGGTIAAVDCAANLNQSDKDITGTGGVTFPNMGPGQNVCNGYQPFPADTIFHKGDVVQFRVQICNTDPVNSQNNAVNVVVTDQLTNLSMPPSGWNAQLDGHAITPTASGSDPNKILTFTIGTVNKGTSRSLTFQAQIATADNFQADQGVFQNSADISYVAKAGGPTTHSSTGTPPIPFVVGNQYPARQEH